MIVIRGCHNCSSCSACRALPEVFTEKWGTIQIDQEKAKEIENIESVCPNGAIVEE